MSYKMKQNPRVRGAKFHARNLLCGASVVAAIVALGIPSGAHAEDRYWDANGTATDSGGTGTWDLGSLNWSPNSDGVSGPYRIWNNAALDDAIFAGTAGTVTLTAPVTVHNLTFDTGGYTLTGGILTLSGSAPTISIVGSSNGAIIDSIIAGNSGLTKGLAGLLALNGANIFSGDVNILAGGLSVNTNAALGVVGNVVNLSDGATLSATGSLIGRTVNLTGGMGLLSGAGVGDAFFTGSGGVQIYNGVSMTNDANDFTGDMSFRVNGSASFTSVGNVGEASSLGAGGTIRFTAVNQYLDRLFYIGVGNSSNRDWEFSASGSTSGAGFINQGTGTLTLTGNITASLGPTRGMLFVAQTGDLELLGTVDSQSNTVVFQGGGVNRTITLSDHNIYSGATEIGSGGAVTVKAGALADTGVASSFGTGSGITVTGGSVLSYTGLGSISNRNWTIASGSIRNDGSGALALSGGVDFGAAANNSLTLGGSFADENTLSGVISGKGSLISEGAGTWVLSAANTREGAILVKGGTLRAGHASAFGTTTGVTVNGGVLDLNGYDLIVPTLAGSGGEVALGAANLAIKTTQNTSYAGVISGDGSLTKSGTGTLTLSGANSYTGPTNIGGGTLALNFAAGGAPTSDIISSSSSLNLAGGTLDITGAAGAPNSQSFNGLNLTAGNNRIAATSGTGGMTVDFGAITRTGGLIDFKLPTNGNFLTSNTILGGWATIGGSDYAKVVGGVITAFTAADYTDKDDASAWLDSEVISDAGGDADTAYFGTVSGSKQLGGLKYSAAAVSTVSIDAGQTLGVDGNIIVAPSVGNANQTISGGSLTGGAGGSVLGILQNGGGNFTIASTIVDNGGSTGLAKGGGGLVTLDGANSYTGTTTISQGVLAVDTIGNGGEASGIGASTANPSSLVIENGTLRYTGATTISDRGFTLVNGSGQRVIEVANGASNLTFAGQVTSADDAGLTKSGAGTLTLANGGNDYVGVTTIDGGTLSVNMLADGGPASGIGASSSESANLVLANSGTLQYSGGSVTVDRGFTLGATAGGVDVTGPATTLGFSGNVVGSGGLRKYGAGTLLLSGTNIYTGDTIVEAGTLQAGSSTAFGTGPMTVNAGAHLALGTFNNTVGGLNGAGTVDLGSATLNIAGGGLFSGTISGTGGLTRNGAFTLTMSGCNNTYTGATTINGTLSTDCLADGGQASGIGASSADSTNLVISSGSLYYTGSSVSIDRGFTAGGNSDIYVTQAATTLGFEGQITGNANLRKRGAGTLVLSGNNIYTGTTHVFEGTLRAGSNTAFGGSGLRMDTAGATVDLDGFDNTVLYINQSNPAVTGGNITLGSATLTISNGGLGNYNGAISGTGGLIKNGTAVQMQTLLGCASSYTGSTIINGGILAVDCLTDGSVNSAIGASSSAASNLQLNGGTLRYVGAGGSTDRQFTLGTAGGTLDASGTGAIDFASAAPATLSGTNAARTLTLAGTNTADNRLAAQIVDNGTGKTSLTKTGAGTWVLANAGNGYTGVTTINGGILTVASLANGGIASSIGASSNAASNLVLGGNNATLRYTGAGDTTDRLFTLGAGVSVIESSGSGAVLFSNTGPAILTGAANSAHVLALGGTNTGNNILGGTLGDYGTGKTTLAKNDSGTWVLTGNNSYTGNTVINNGNLVIGDGGTTGNAGAGNVIVDAATSTLSINRSDTFNFTGTLSGPGTLAQIGTGTTVLTSAGSAIGVTTISAGTLQIDGTLATQTLTMNGTSALTVNGTVQAAGAGPATITGDAGAHMIIVGAGGVLGVNGNLGDGSNVVNLSGTLATGSAALALGAGNNRLVLNDGAVLTGVGVDAGAGIDTLEVNNAVSFTLNGSTVSGFESLDKQNVGVLTLIGDHDYSDGTTIGAGTLQLGNGGTSGSLAGDVVNAGTLAFNRSNALTFAGDIIGGTVRQVGAGTTTLTGTSSYAGTIVTNGALRIEGQIANSNAGLVSVTGNNSSLTVSGATASFTANGNISTIGSAAGVTINVENGGRFQTTANLPVAQGAGTVATVNVTGPGSRFQAGSTLNGTNGTSFFNVTDGGYINAVGSTSLGALLTNPQAGSSTVLVSGPGSRWDSLNRAYLGDVSISLLDGGVMALGATIMSYAGKTATTLISGAGSELAAASLTFAENGNAAITVADAGKFTLNNGAGIFNVGTGGVVNIGGAVGESATAAGTLNVASVALKGALNFNHDDDAYLFDRAISGIGTVRQVGTGTTILTADNSHSGGTTISDGALQLGNGGTSGSIAGNVANDGALIFDRSDVVTFGGVISGGGSVEQAGTGRTIVTNANTYTGGTTVSAGSLHLGNGGTTGGIVGDVTNNGALIFNRSDAVTFGGLISGTGSTEQAGTGTTIVTADNSYTGATNVSGGTLLVNGDQSAATGLVNVASGATLGGIGTIGGSVDVASGGILTAGSNGVGTLMIGGDLSLGSTSVLNMEFGAAGTVGGALNDLIEVGGNLTLAGTLNVSESAGGTFGPGVYRVLNYDGTLTDNGLALGGMPAGSVVLLQTSVANQVNLINSAGAVLNFWDGMADPKNNSTVNGGDGVWEAAGTANNWTDSAGTLNGAYAQDGVAIFQGTAGTVTVDNGLGTVRSGGMQFATSGYTITGDAITLSDPQSIIRVGDGTAAGAAYTATIGAVLTGNAQLVKADLGTLALTGANSYTGGTSISTGTLQIGAGGTTGAIAGDVINNAALVFNRSDDTNFAGNISGTGAVTQTGGGILRLTGASSYAGATNVIDSELRLESGGTISNTSGTALRGTNATLTVTGAGSALTTTGLSFATSAGNPATVNVENGGHLAVTGSAQINVGNSLGNVSTLNVKGAGSRLDTAGAIVVGLSGAATGIVNITDGGVVHTDSLQIGPGFIVQTTGSSTVTIAGTGSQWTSIGLGLSQGTMSVLDGGSFTSTGQTASIGTIGAGGQILVSGTGSNFTLAGDATIGTGTGTLTVADGANASIGGTATLARVASATGILNIGGAQGNAAAGSGAFDAAALVFGPGDARLNFNHTDTIYRFATQMSGAGTINQMAGVTALTGDSSAFTGMTSVSGGRLLVSNALGGNVGVATGGTLGGIGTIGGNVTIADGSLNPGDVGAAPGTLTIDGNLSLAGASTLNYNFGQANVVGGLLNDLTAVGGDLTLDGTLNVTVPTGGGFGAGVYRVLTYGGTLTDNGLDLGTMPAGSDMFVQTAVDNQVNLVNTAGLTLSFWDGPAGPKNDGTLQGGTGMWRLGGGANDWTELTGAVNADYAQDVFAVFMGAPGMVTVDNGTGAVRASGLQFGVDGYVIAGGPLTLSGTAADVRVGDGTAAGAAMTATIAADLTGTARLVKADLGTLVLTGANSYVGGTAISDGVLQLGDGGTTGSIVGGIANNGVLAFNRSDAMTFDGLISGTGAVAQNGAGTTILTADNSYAGGTTITAGTLQLGNGGTTGSIVGDVANEGVLTFNRSDAMAFGGLISGTGAVAQNGAGTTILTADNSYAGGTTITAGTLQLGNGETTGSIVGDVANNAVLTFNRSDTLTFSGLISGTGTVAQNGSGTTILTGANSFAGATMVNAGTLLVNGDQSAAIGATSVASGATLGGIGTIGGDVTIADGANLNPGSVGVEPGMLTINGNLGLSSGSALNYDFGQANVVGGPLNDLVTVTGNLTLDGTLNVATAAGGSFDAGIYRVIDYAGTLTNEGLAIGTIPAGTDFFVQTSVAQQVNLINTNGLALRFWDGDAGTRNDGLITGGDGLWRNDGASDNWTLADATINAPFLDAAFAVFQGTGGTVTTDTNLGAINVSGMQFAADGYVIQGDAINLVAPQSVVRVGDGTAAGASLTATIGAELAGNGQLVKTDLGTLILTGANSYTGGTTINGGTLQIASDASLGDLAGGLGFAGGTLQTIADLTSDRTVSLTGAGTLLTDDGTSLSLSGVISGVGPLSKRGTGTLILSGANDYAGATTVAAGTLLINGDQSGATGLTSVNNGATVGGVGMIGGNVTLADGAALNPGGADALPGTLAINGNLSMTGGSTLNMQFGEANVVGGALNDLVTVGGDLVLDGTLNVTVPAGGAFDPGIYRVFNYAGTLTDNGLQLGAMPAGSTSTVQASVAQQVNLVNTGGLLLNFWDGDVGPKFDGVINGGDGLWQNSTGNDNWADESGVVNAAYADGAFAIFAGTGGNVTVDGSLGDITASGMQFASDGYAVSGDAITLTGPQSTIRVGDGTTAGADMTATIGSVLIGDTQLVKSDAGMLILSGINGYTGGTAIDGGTLQITADANLGDGAGGLSFNGGSLQTTADLDSDRNVSLTGTGTILTDGGTTFTVDGLLSGTGELTKHGTGTLLLTGDNSTYTAATHVTGGTLAVDNMLGSAVDVQSGGRLEGNGQVGSIANSGVVAPGRGGIGTLTVGGDYASNGGTLEIETVLGNDSSSTDRLVVNGTTSGSTQVNVFNRGGLGGQTVEGVRIIDVVGASNGTFVLNGDYVFQGEQAVIAGAYGYRLYKNGVADPADGDWYLRSALLDPATPEEPQGPLYQPGVPVYEGYAQNLLALNGLPTLQQRVGNRSWAGAGVQGGMGIWGRMEGSRQRPSAVVSTSDADKNINTWQMQMGLDRALSERSDGAMLIGGITAHYGKANSSVRSIFGSGSIETKGYGLGATLTWYGPQGFYVDGQTRMSWYDSDLKSGTLGRLADGNDGKGQAFSLEVGKRSPVGGKFTLTPQIQMVYSHVNFDRFVDPADATVSADKGSSLKTRGGMSIDHQNSWDSSSGDTRRSHLYALMTLSYEWLDGTRADVSGAPIVNRDHRLLGEIGLGASYSWGGDRFTLYSEVSADTSIADFGNGYSLKGNVGLRIKF